MNSEDEGFDSAKAELFEAIGHPYRIRIIQALESGVMGFAELKKAVGIGSSGHLAFHLGKLENLVALNEEGRYALTGEGREALHMVQTVREKSPRSRQGFSVHSVRRPIVAALLVLMVVLAAVAAVQQFEIANLTNRPPGTAELDGKAYWFASVPAASLGGNNITVMFRGVEFTLVNPHEVTQILGFLNGQSVSIITQRLNVSTWNQAYGVYWNVVAKYTDGSTEVMVMPPTIRGGGMIVFSPWPSYPWFSAHSAPRVAVVENMSGITMYVGAGN